MNKITLEDPRLTAYALGELPPSEANEVQEQIAAEPDLREYVEDIQALGAQLASEFRLESSALVTRDVTTAVEARKIASFPWRKLAALGVAAGLVISIMIGVLFQNRSGKVAERIEPSNEATSLLALKSDQTPPLASNSPVNNVPAAPEAGSMVEFKQIMASPAMQSAPRKERERQLVTATEEIPDSAMANVVPLPAKPSELADNLGGGALEAAPQIGAPAMAGAVSGPPLAGLRRRFAPSFANSESYASIQEGGFRSIQNAGDERSTFSIDVDTASYSNIRRFLNQGVRPPANAVRIEEMINYFDYDYPQPKEGEPFAIDLEAAEAPWASGHRLLRVGLQGKSIDTDRRPYSNLVFLIDVSGSMNEPDKLPLLKDCLRDLSKGLRASDSVSLVTYAGSTGVALQPTSGDNQAKITDAIDRLSSSGGTNGEAGLKLAYDLAAKQFRAEGVNRVILATDGDFNVGVTNTDELAKQAATRAKQDRIFLTILGFGQGNLQDARMEQIANKANGSYHYIDGQKEGHKVLVTQMSGTLVTVAKDVKIQVEFNPAKVASYRLIGYENRVLANRDFNDDSKDAGEIGAGHRVTALYEIVPRGGGLSGPNDEPLKYRELATVEPPKDVIAPSRDLVTVRLRYKKPEAEESLKIETSLIDEGKNWAQASANTRFAAAVASFGMLLRDSPHKGSATFASVKDWAESAKDADEFAWKKEFLDLVERAAGLPSLR